MTESAAKIAEKLYAQTDQGADYSAADGAQTTQDDDVVDAEFEEVKDDEKK